ncbi:MAG: 2-amino-4-hydroxy-6-hydroxymethyldihydropteridine diphosphokinase [Victivallales bacterium]|nr:2-amino-4-hydroxy-6-hydroxymethyldihydropteridine diphosphokinase [Victivallales bacterium]
MKKTKSHSSNSPQAIALALGANQGNLKTVFLDAAEALKQAGLEDIKLSPFYKTTPVGCAPGTPDFINAALTGTWHESVEKLHELCKELEEISGRPRNHARNTSRPLDLDIIFFGQESINTPELTIPHKEAANRLFVLVPLSDIAGDWMFPGMNMNVAEILEPYKSCSEFRQLCEGRIDFN